MPASERTDPYPNFRFRVEIGSILTAGFSEVRGLGMSLGKHAEGTAAADVPAWKRLLERDMTWGASLAADSLSTDRTESPTLKLRRGVTDSSELWDWFRDWIDGAAEPADVRVILLDRTGEESRGWRCKRARPVRWDGPTLAATESRVAMETFELAHDGIEALDLHG